MKSLLLKNWHVMRWIRLVFGLFLVEQAFETTQWIFLGFAAFFLFQALFNLGCTTNGCQIPQNKNKSL